MLRLSAVLKMLLLTQKTVSTQLIRTTYNMRLLCDQTGCVRV
jgi:hypothetical protein